jgi:unsaturated pyranuronate lyase
MAKAKRASTAKKKGIAKPTSRRKARGPRIGGLKHVPWTSVELEDLNPNMQRQFVVGDQVMIARILLKKGGIVPLHSHHNEQVSYILEGALKFWIDGKEILVSAGEVLAIPPYMPHKVEAMADTVDLDIFCPPRQDWINKTDQYLRGSK